MIKYTIAAIALLAGTSLVYADPADHGNSGGGGMSNSASEHAPGRMKDSGSAKDLAPGQRKDLAPGQRKDAGSSAKELAAGQMKDNSASRSDDKNFEHRSQKEADRSAKNSDRNERNARDTSDRAKDADRNAKNDMDRGERKSEHNAKNDDSDRSHGTRTKESRDEHIRSNSSTGASEGTEGRSERRGSIASVTSEQKTRIKTVFSRHHVEPARNLNVAVNVGVALPRSVHLYPIPEDIVVIVPDYRGYDYIMLDDDRVAIVDPETYEVVDIIEIA